MRDDLRISIIQSPIVWEDPSENLTCFEKRVASLEGCSDLAVLPEMFTTGFTMSPEAVAEPVDGNTMECVRNWASDYRLAFAGSFVAEDNGHYFNRAFFAEPDGKISFYDKRHLFSMAGENKAYSPGNESVVVNYKGWNIALFVCYDLRFPVWSRNVGNRYDVALYVANWPEVRSTVWHPLLQTRAIENQSYVCGVNRTGTDGKGFRYIGGSVVYSPKGKMLLDAGDIEEFVDTVSLSSAELEMFRKKFPVWSDADTFTL